MRWFLYFKVYEILCKGRWEITVIIEVFFYDLYIGSIWWKGKLYIYDYDAGQTVSIISLHNGQNLFCRCNLCPHSKHTILCSQGTTTQKGLIDLQIKHFSHTWDFHWNILKKLKWMSFNRFNKLISNSLKSLELKYNI